MRLGALTRCRGTLMEAEETFCALDSWAGENISHRSRRSRWNPYRRLRVAMRHGMWRDGRYRYCICPKPTHCVICEYKRISKEEDG
jgi:hypothetical protein